jgi:phage recombination protein Bet
MTSTAIVPIDPTERANWMTLVKTTLARAANLTDNDLQMFATVAEHLGLDPWRKEVYAIRYGQNSPISFVIGVDGYLRKAAETGLFDGADPILYAGPDAQWTELWVSDEPPYAAKATVYRKGSSHGITYIARYKTAYRGINALWKTQPDIQLGINALKHALRRAFGDAFGNLDQHIIRLRAEGAPIVDEDTGEIMEPAAIEEPAERETEAHRDMEHDRAQEAKVTPPQPRTEPANLSTRFWAAARKAAPQGVSYQTFAHGWLQDVHGTTDFALLSPDDQEKAVIALEELPNA